MRRRLRQDLQPTSLYSVATASFALQRLRDIHELAEIEPQLFGWRTPTLEGRIQLYGSLLKLTAPSREPLFRLKLLVEQELGRTIFHLWDQ